MNVTDKRGESAAEREARVRAELARDALQFLPPDLPRNDWVTAMIAALGEGIPEETVRAWSAQGAKYTTHAFNSTWKSIQKAHPLGIGALINLAKRYGYVVPSQLKRTNGVNHAAARTICKPGVNDDTAQVAKLLAALWTRFETARPADPSHGYLQRKGVLPHFARQEKDTLLIALFDVRDGRFAGLQEIPSEAGACKKFPYGTQAKCGFSLIDWPVPIDARDPSCEAAPVLVCEGWATGATLAECLPWCWVVAAMNEGNLPRVALELARKDSRRCYIACGDDDRKPDGTERADGNIGRVAAMQAADHIAALTGRTFGHAYVLPVFSEASLSGDFNDMREREGASNVCDLVASAIRGAE